MAVAGVIQFLREHVVRVELETTTDTQLLKRFIADRDEAAFAALVRRHGAMVWGVCKRVLYQDQDAEDAFQATFVVLIRKAASIRPPSMVGNWLYGVAHQISVKARAMNAKKMSREKHLQGPLANAAAKEDPWQELQPVLDHELSLLPDKYRAIIVLCDLEGKTRREAATLLGVPEGTVAGRQARGRAMLAKRLARHGFAVSGATLAGVLAQGVASASAPTSVVAATIKSSSLAGGGVLSAKVAALAEGVVKAMLLTKLKTVGALVLILCVLGAGATMLTHHTLAAGQQEAKKELASKPEINAPDAPAAKPEDDKERLQGTWHIVEVTTGEGPRSPREASKDQILVFTRDKLVFNYDDGASTEMMYQIDPKQKPKAIDLAPTAQPEKGFTFKGIYEIDGDRLKLYYSRNVDHDAKRPARFDSKKDPGDRFFILKRIPAVKALEEPGKDAKASKDRVIFGVLANERAEPPADIAPDRELPAEKGLPKPQKLARIPDPSPELRKELYAFDSYRHGSEEKFVDLERKADELLKRYTGRDDQARICFEVAHVAAQSDIRNQVKRVRKYAGKSLAMSRDPLQRSRLYSYLGSAAEVEVEKTFDDRRRHAAKELLAGYAEMLAQKLPEKAPELPAVDKLRGEGIDPTPDEAALARHAVQLAARLEAEFIRDLVDRRDTLSNQLRWLYHPDPKIHGRNPDGPEELRALAGKVLNEPKAVKALLALVTMR